MLTTSNQPSSVMQSQSVTPMILFNNQEDAAAYGSLNGGLQGSIYASGLDDIEVKSASNNKTVVKGAGGKQRSCNAGSIVSQ